MSILEQSHENSIHLSSFTFLLVYIYTLNSRIGHRVYPEQVMDQIISHEAFTFSLGLYN